MASDYCDLMRPGVAQFAYLKCPSKVRAAVINAGGPRLSLETIQRRLEELPTGERRMEIGEPDDTDAADFRVAGLVRREPIKPRRITEQERLRIAELAKRIGDRPKPRKAENHRERGSALHYGGTGYATNVIDRVCEGMEIPQEVFFSLTRQKYVVAARSLVVKLLRDRNPEIYPYPRIAKIVGRGDHSTAINAFQQFETYCQMFPVLVELYAELRGGE